jgi:hypothetical protein
MSNHFSQPRVHPARALRTRLALAYTVLTLFLTGLLGIASYFGLNFALERRLREETIRYGQELQARFDNPINEVKKEAAFYGEVYYQFHDLQGKPVAGFQSSNLENLLLPTQNGLIHLENRVLWVGHTNWTLRSQVFGRIYVAVDARELEQVRKFAWISLAGLAFLATILAFPLGYTRGCGSSRRHSRPFKPSAAWLDWLG